MKTLGILILTVFLAVFSTSAMAASVTINGTGGGTLTSLSLDSLGNAVLNLTGLTCTAGAGTVACTNNAPTISVNGATSTVVAGSTITATVTTGDANGNAVTVGANYGSVSGTTWSWTPASSTAAGTYGVTLTANDGQTCNNTASVSFNISVTAPAVTTGGTTTGGTTGTPAAGSILLPMDTQRAMSIPSGGVHYYYFVTPTAFTGAVTVQITTADWQTDQDLIISNKVQPLCTDIVGTMATGANGFWYNTGASNNETVTYPLSTRIASITLPAGTTLFATVCNKTVGKTGAYKIFWGGY